MEKTHKLVFIDDEYYLLSNKKATENQYVICDDNTISKHSGNCDISYYSGYIIGSTNKKLKGCLLLERKLVNQKIPSNNDKLVLLKRLRPDIIEIHRGSISQDHNLILTTKDDIFAKRLVDGYNSYLDGVEYNCTIEYHKVYHVKRKGITELQVTKGYYTWTPKTAAFNSKYINILKISA